MIADEEKLKSFNLWTQQSILDDNSFSEDFMIAEETLVLLKLTRLGAHMY